MATTYEDTEVNLVINNIPSEELLLEMEQNDELEANQIYNTPDNSTPIVYNIENAYYRLPLGSIFSSSIPQTSDDIHLLDGSVISLTDRYLPFYVLLNSLVQQGYDIYYESDGTHTAAELRAEDITNTGNAGKFLLDSTNNTLQLPTITTFIQGLTNLTNLGNSVEAGLPNITGSIGIRHMDGSTSLLEEGNGSIYKTKDGASWSNGLDYASNKQSNEVINLDASLSNSIYGNSTTVQPASVKYPYYIVLAQSPLADMVTDVQPNPQGETIANLTSLQINGVNYAIESGMSNPMTTTGDIIIGGASGTATRLGIGTNGQVLTSNGTTISWQTPSGGGGGSGVTSIGGATGAITLGSGLSMNGNELSATGGGSGGGITNYEVINRPSSLPTATATSPDFVEYNGNLYKKTYTNLTNTTWVFNDNIISSSSLIKYINFTSNSNNYTRFEATNDDRIIYDSTSAYGNLGWVNSEYKTIQITGGSDVNDTDLMTFLEANATLQENISIGYEYQSIVSSSSSEGLPLGFIFSSALPLFNANYHLLNGDSIAIADYGDFNTLLTTLVSQNWDLTCTANEYAEDIAKTGNCGKFVINDTSSDITGTYDTTTITVSANSIKLPTITRFIQGVSSITDLGNSVEAGLPNITGTTAFAVPTKFFTEAICSGAFIATGSATNVGKVNSTSTITSTNEATLDASRSSSIYGNSSEVQPNATKYPYYIVLKNNSNSGLMNYLNNLAEAGVQSLGNAVGDITLENGIQVLNNMLKLVSENLTINTTKTNQHDTVIESYISSDGLTWYRIWASGWKECGISIASVNQDSTTTINLPITFSNTEYLVLLQSKGGKRNSTQCTNGQSVNTRYISSLIITSDDYSYGRFIYCCGI